MNRVRMSRRAFVGAGAAAATLLNPRTVLRAADPIGRSRPSHLKLSLASYSYRQYLQGPQRRLDLIDFANLAADLGLDAIEPTSYYFPPDVADEALRRLRLHAFKLGLDISGTAIGNDFCLPDGPARERQLELVRTWIDRAAVLAAPVIRIFAGTVPKGDSESAAVARAVAGIEQSLEYAAGKGIALALENHGGVTATPDQILGIVTAVKAPRGNFGINLDTGNFHGSDPYEELARIAPYALNVQLKTEIQPRGGSKVEADLERLVGILREARYSGYVVLEYEAEPDPLKAIPQIIPRLRRLIS